MGPFGFVVGLLVIVFLGTTVRYSTNARQPRLEPSCSVPALALSAASIPRGGALRWTAVGPGDEVVIAIGAARLSADLTATPLPGASELQVVRPATALKGCKATGVLGVQVPAGAHTVSVFPAGGGSPLASRPLTVTER